MEKLFLLYGSEDGAQIFELDPHTDLAKIMEDHGIDEWMERPHNNDWDTNYWPEGSAMLIKGKIVVPKAKQAVTKWEI